jgi:peptide/nickel transport system substrate-binding protein
VLRRSAIEVFVLTLILAFVQTAMARTRPHYGGTLRIETQADVWQKFASPARRLVFEGLTHVDSAGMIRPALAVSWKNEDADHRWQFQLRPGIHFHDSSPLTAAAVVSSLQESCSASCPWTAIRTVGTQITFTSDSPMPNLAALLAGEAYLIQHPSANGGVDGTGPFQPAGFNNGILTLKANVDHWAGRPFVDTIEVRSRRALRDQWTDLEAGHADIVEVPAESLRQAKQQHLTLLESRPIELVALQVDAKGTLADVNLRRAIGLAIDRSAIFNVIFQKQGEITASLAPQWITGYAFLFPQARDVSKSHELRGGASPPAVTLAVDDANPALQLAAGRIALNLREAGFNVQTVAKGSRPKIDLLLREIPLEQGTAGAVVDAIQRSLSDHPAFEAPANSGSAEEQSQTNLHFEQQVLANSIVIPLVCLPRGYAVGGRVRDLHLNLDGTIALADASLEESR